MLFDLYTACMKKSAHCLSEPQQLHLETSTPQSARMFHVLQIVTKVGVVLFIGGGPGVVIEHPCSQRIGCSLRRACRGTRR